MAMPGSRAALPAFLRQSNDALYNRFSQLNARQEDRLGGSIYTDPTTDTSNQWSRSGGPGISDRNRYFNIAPFVGSRIKLQVAAGHNDYINASPIVLEKAKYISTQGPLPTSTSNFYRMLAAETGQVAVVVMLTRVWESGKEKCFQYFPYSASHSPMMIPPDPGATDDFQCEVDLLDIKEDPESFATIRHCHLRTRLSSSDQWDTKEVWHLLYSAWPDYGVPTKRAEQQALIHLRNLSRRLNAQIDPPVEKGKLGVEEVRPAANADANAQRGTTAQSDQRNPRIVHCSAGVGRTGTFIALDDLLAQLEAGELDNVDDNRDPIAELVDNLRQQRMMMVQGETQYYLLYELLAAAWHQRQSTL